MKTPPKQSPPGKASATGTGQVRIIGGQWRGTKLPVVDVPGLRPSSDRVRETVFNWLQPVLPGARVLDLFAGSGAFGLEAVSRGAREAHLVERDARAHQCLQASVERLQARHAVHLHRADAIAWLRAPLHGRFDVVFMDPPFAAGLWDDALALLPPWLAGDAWLYLESPSKDPPTAGPVPGPPGWTLHREGRTREVRYALFRGRDPGTG
ncbi:MAG TPA: 16S rRNA (guanine(966)-N(2))-methyltransferase RsmD [Xanthomonadaceae bacterium]|nr:16S rRNA (guanine(966)-N(2))-methyltransferase RsmD [Xanthomonadaceae bacterium]